MRIALHPFRSWVVVLAVICGCVLSAIGGVSAFAQDQGQAGGQALSIFRQAYALTGNARTIEDFDRIITMCEQGLNDDDDTDEDYGRSLAAWAYNKRGELFAGQAEDAEAKAAALADFDKAVTLAPNSWRFLHNRGVSLAGAGRFEEAVADVEKVIELQPQFAKGYFNRAELHFAAGEMEQAVDAYTRAIDLGRNDAEAYANRGDANAALGRSQQALRDYQRAISLQTNMARAYQAAAWILASATEANLRNPREALRLATTAAQLRPDDFQAIDILALCQAATGAYAQAAASEQRAIDLAQAAEAGEDVVNEFQERLQQYESRMNAAQQTGGGR